MRTKIKYLIVSILVLLFYYIITICLSPSGRFVKDINVVSISKEEAEKLNILISDSLYLNFNSNNSRCEDLKFWLSQNRKWKQYGFLPIGYHSNDENHVILNLIYPEHLSSKKLWIEFENYSKMSEHSMQGRFYKANSKVHVIIKDDDEVVLCELDVDLGESSN
jgi:hypothetical protein